MPSYVEDAALRPPSQRVLLRLLETTVPDRDLRDRALRLSLASAGLDALPIEFDDMLVFAREHLAVHLDDEDRPWLVSSLLEDLEAEAENARFGGDAASAARMAVATRMIPDKGTATQPAPADVDVPINPIPSLPVLDLGDLDMGDVFAMPPQSMPPSASLLRSSRPLDPEPAPPTRPRIERPAVLLVDPDRFGRAALSRGLVQQRCDVTVLDGRDDAIAAIDGTDPFDVLVLDVDAPGSDAILEALVTTRPDAPVVLRTKGDAAVAEHVARFAGVEHVAVVARGARAVDVVDAIRRLV